MTTQSRPIGAVAYLVPLAGPLGVLASQRDQVSRYHAFQALAIDAGTLAAPLAWAVLGWALSWLPTVGPLAGIVIFGLVLAFEVLLFVSRLLGAARALRGVMQPAPVVGGLAERWAAGGEPAAPAPAPADPGAESLRDAGR